MPRPPRRVSRQTIPCRARKMPRSMSVDADDAIARPWVTGPAAPARESNSAAAAAACEGAGLAAHVETVLPGPWLQIGTIEQFEWTRVELPVPGLPASLDGLRILHLTDLHFLRTWHPAYDDLLARVRADPPEIVAITGDFVDDKRDHTRALPFVGRLATALHAIVPRRVYAIHGNHDGDLIGPRLGAWGVRLITLARAEANVRGDGAPPIELVGFPGTEREDLDESFLRALPPRRAGVPRVVLSHYPDFVGIAGGHAVRADVVLAGHTHGGQIRLPTGRAIVTHDSLPQRYASGVHRLAGTWLVVGRGMGFSKLPIRMWCPAQVIDVRLRRMKEEG